MSVMHVDMCFDVIVYAIVHVTLWAPLHLEAMSTAPWYQYSVDNLNQVCSCGRLSVHPKELPLRS